MSKHDEKSWKTIRIAAMSLREHRSGVHLTKKDRSKNRNSKQGQKELRESLGRD